MTTRTGRGGGLALTGICLGFFLVLFDATAVNVATGGIARGLGASVITLQWVLNAYTVAFAALMLTAGSLGDRWGARRVYQGEKEIELTSTEFKLLEFFLTHPGTAWSREQLLREVWGEQHYVTPRTVDVHIRRLREQIEEKPDDPGFLVTVRGFGYRFEPQ